jgi:hypothetical protein
LQLPVQTPSEQMFGQALPFFQVPFGSQVRGTLPSHMRRPGLHSPVHWPALQTNSHAGEGSKVPIWLQVRTVWLAPQRFSPGRQSPAQLPLEQRFIQTVPAIHMPF